MEVWYKLDDEANKLPFNGVDVADFKKSLEMVWGDQLHCPYPLLNVNSALTLKTCLSNSSRAEKACW